MTYLVFSAPFQFYLKLFAERLHLDNQVIEGYITNHVHELFQSIARPFLSPINKTATK